MPTVYLTKNQQRGKAVLKIIADYIFESGETKKSLLKRAGFSSTAFYSRIRNPETFTLEEIWRLFDLMNVPPEIRTKIIL